MCVCVHHRYRENLKRKAILVHRISDVGSILRMARINNIHLRLLGFKRPLLHFISCCYTGSLHHRGTSACNTIYVVRCWQLGKFMEEWHFGMAISVWATGSFMDALCPSIFLVNCGFNSWNGLWPLLSTDTSLSIELAPENSFICFGRRFWKGKLHWITK